MNIIKTPFDKPLKIKYLEKDEQNFGSLVGM